MATLVLTAVGTAVGGPIGGAIGALIGQSADALLFAPKARQGPRLGDLSVQTSSYGTAIPKLFGTMRVAGTVIWSTDLIERRATSGGGKGRGRSVDYSYAASFAVALSGRQALAVRRIWADGKLLRGAAGDWKVKTGFRFHSGDEDQEADPLIAAAESGEAPAFRGIAYAVFEEMELAEYGNRIPSLSFELVADAAQVPIGVVAEAVSGGVVRGGETPAVAGFAASGDSVRAAIESLAEVVPLTLRDQDGLRLERAEGETFAIDPAAEIGSRAVMRGASFGPGEVSVAYHDAARDYQIGLQRARLGAGGGPVDRRALPAVMAADAAKQIAEHRLDALAAARETVTVTLGWSAAAIKPGSLLELDGLAGAWRVSRRTIGAMSVRLELVRTAAGVAAPVSAEAGRAAREADRPHGPTELRLIELPGEGDMPIVVAAAAGRLPGWRGAVLSVSRDGGASWSDIGRTAAPAVIGRAAGVLAAGGSALFDAAAAIEVELLHQDMVLIGRDDDALVGGANLALLGEELIQFGRAEPIGPRRYRLSRLLRGRRGTEWAATLHEVDETFTLIDGTAQARIDVGRDAAAGAPVSVLASGIGDAEPVAAGIRVEGLSLRPPSPVHLRYGGDEIRWTRRSRAGWSWTSGADTPVGEEAERYRVTFAGDAGMRSVEVAVPRLPYGPTERLADGAGAVTVSVVQIGTFASSRPAILRIS